MKATVNGGPAVGGEGRRAVVTGAASGIGQAVALRLLREGVKVIAVDRNEAGLTRAIDAGAEPFVGDLTSEGDRDRLVDIGQGAHYLVNSAGIIKL
jgi:NAD(P)-dependent dehydrogenase (short-subunit alcohol dehydrogenase family)